MKEYKLAGGEALAKAVEETGKAKIFNTIGYRIEKM